MNQITKQRSGRYTLPDSVLYYLSVKQYHKMIDHAIFDDSDRVELLEGLLFDKRSNETDRSARLYKLSVSQFHNMIAHGIFDDDDRVELLEGILVAKMTHDPIHDSTLSNILHRFTRILTDDWVLRVQCAITLGESEPEPDVAVVRGPGNQYKHRHPGAKDIGQLTEVSHTSLNIDQKKKLPMYARARIPIYWIVNVVDNQIEVYTDPKGGKSPGYRAQAVYKPSDKIPLILDAETIGEIPVDDLL